MCVTSAGLGDNLVMVKSDGNTKQWEKYGLIKSASGPKSCQTNVGFVPSL